MSKSTMLQQIENILQTHPKGVSVREISRQIGTHSSAIFRCLPRFEEKGILLWEHNGKIGIFTPDPSVKKITRLDEPLEKLRSLLNERNNEEVKYQSLIQDYPWILGYQYRLIERHRKFDDENIPDFTGVRAWDGCRDIFEIKPPFLKLFREDGEFSSDFNESWNQTERYLDFAHLERDYLQRKGLLFDNPRCILIAGFMLSDREMKKIRTKQRMNPSIQLLTYNELLASIQHAIEFLRRLKIEDDF